MKKLALSAAAVALCLGGCAQIDTWAQNQVINPLANVLRNPNTQFVASVVSKETVAFACIISAGSAVAGALEANPAFNAAQSTQGTNLKIFTASTAACTQLQGILGGQVTAPAGSVVVSQ